jgi:hypothetical protein
MFLSLFLSKQPPMKTALIRGFPATVKHNCELRIQKGRELNVPSIEALARPNRMERQAAPGWARALGSLLF